MPIIGFQDSNKLHKISSQDIKLSWTINFTSVKVIMNEEHSIPMKQFRLTIQWILESTFDGAQKDLHVKEKLHLGALKDNVVM